MKRVLRTASRSCPSGRVVHERSAGQAEAPAPFGVGLLPHQRLHLLRAGAVEDEHPQPGHEGQDGDELAHVGLLVDVANVDRWDDDAEHQPPIAEVQDHVMVELARREQLLLRVPTAVDHATDGEDTRSCEPRHDVEPGRALPADIGQRAHHERGDRSRQGDAEAHVPGEEASEGVLQDRRQPLLEDERHQDDSHRGQKERPCERHHPTVVEDGVEPARQAQEIGDGH